MEQQVTSLEPTNGRIHYWDNVKGLLIILVLIGHFIAPYSCLHSLWNWIYLFHMPAFIVVCGYFSRRSSLQAPKMLKILLVFLVLNYTLMAITQGRAVSHWEWARVYYTAWFLLAVLLYRLTIPLLDRWNKPAALLFFSVVGLAAGLMREPDAFCLYKILPLYPFFIVGYTLAQRHERRWVPSPAVWKVGAGLLILAMLFVAGNWAIQHQILTGRHLLWEPYDFYFRDAVARGILYFTGLVGTLGICWICPQHHLPIITRSGHHSLILYTIHRPVTILTAALIPALHWGNGSVWMLVGALALTLLLCLLPATTHLFHAFFDTLVRALTTSRGSLAAMASLLLLAAAGLGSAGLLFHLRPKAEQQALHVLQADQKQQLDSCLKISFIGDIILLRPQVHRGYDPATDAYSFADLFRYTHAFFQDDDLSIAVFEGPCAGEEVGYTTTTCEDGNPIRLNFPDVLARNVKEAGIDLVTTANNHLLDCGYEAALRTLRVLDEADLPHLGSYAPENRGPRHKIVKMEQGGVTTTIALLSYTYGSNYTPEKDFYQEPYHHLTTVLADPQSPFYPQALARVKQEIASALADKPDCLIILPHQGTQFRHEPDAYQKHWCRVFASLGADVILADHPHATQPCEWIPGAGKSGQTLVVHCPGNYANSYTRADGDAAALVEVYLSPDSGAAEAAAVIPLWVSAHGESGAASGGQFIPTPVAQVARGNIGGVWSNKDWERLDEVSRIITGSMLGREIPLDTASLRYYMFAGKPGQVFRDAAENALPKEYVARYPLFHRLAACSRLCFVGDSITEGTMNLGYGWFEPLAAALPHTRVSRFAKGSMQSAYFLAHADDIAAHQADLYIMAYGTNDIRYRNQPDCARHLKTYISNIESTVKAIRDKQPTASFLFIAPWTSDLADKNCRMNDKDKWAMMQQYSDSLRQWCQEQGHTFVDPNPILRARLLTLHANRSWLVDAIHPNGTTGPRIYSEAVLEAAGKEGGE